jgi:hypothetical protein
MGERLKKTGGEKKTRNRWNTDGTQMEDSEEEVRREKNREWKYKM